MVTLSEGLSDRDQGDKDLKHHSVIGRKCPVSSAWTWALRSFPLMKMWFGERGRALLRDKDIASPASGDRPARHTWSVRVSRSWNRMCWRWPQGRSPHRVSPGLALQDWHRGGLGPWRVSSVHPERRTGLGSHAQDGNHFHRKKKKSILNVSSCENLLKF